MRVYAYTLNGNGLGHAENWEEASSLSGIGVKRIKKCAENKIVAVDGIIWKLIPKKVIRTNEQVIDWMKELYYSELEDKSTNIAERKDDATFIITRDELESRITSPDEKIAFELYFASGLDISLKPDARRRKMNNKYYLNIDIKQKTLGLIPEYRKLEKKYNTYKEAYGIFKELVEYNQLKQNYYIHDKTTNEIVAEANTIEHLAEQGGVERVFGTPSEIKQILNGTKENANKDKYNYVCKHMTEDELKRLSNFRIRVLVENTRFKISFPLREAEVNPLG